MALLQCTVRGAAAVLEYTVVEFGLQSGSWTSLVAGLHEATDLTRSDRQWPGPTASTEPGGSQPGYSTQLGQTAFDAFRADSQLLAMQWTDRSVWTVSERAAVSHEGLDAILVRCVSVTCECDVCAAVWKCLGNTIR